MSRTQDGVAEGRGKGEMGQPWRHDEDDIDVLEEFGFVYHAKLRQEACATN